MALTMLDVTALGGGCAIGDIATFLGRDGHDVLLTDEVAARGGVSPYELLTGLRLRLPRRYFERLPDPDAQDAFERVSDLELSR